MEKARLWLAVIVSLALLASCGDAGPVGAWSGSAPDENETSVEWGISEISDALPRVQRQIGPGGPIRSFMEEPDRGLIARARIIDVEPRYSIVRDPGTADSPETEIRNDPRHKVVDYGADGARWSTSEVTVEIVDDYGEPNFDARQLAVEGWGVVEDFEAFVDADVIIGTGKGLDFHATNGVFGLEWRLLSISPINDDGTISWPDEMPVGRSTTIDAFEEIALDGEIVVTTDDSFVAEVVERRPRDDAETPAPSRTPPRSSS